MSSILTALEDLETQLDEAMAHDPAGLPGSVLAEALERQVRIRNKCAALDARLAGAFDASKEWAANGSRSAAAWMVTVGRERKCVADRRVRQGKALRGMPVTWAAFARGEINVDHVDELISVRTGREQVFTDSERRLVGHAIDKRFRLFLDELEYWTAIVDPQGADDDAEAELADEHLHASESFQGQVRLDGWLGRVGGSLVTRELDRLCDWLFAQDWAEATARLGEGNVTAADLHRNPAERRAAALILMAERSGAMSLGAAGTATKTVLNVVMDWATFCAELARLEGRTDLRFPDERTCRLDDGTIIAPSQALSLGLAGHLRGLILDPDGVPLHFGQTHRGFTGDLRTAVQLTHPYCGHGAGCDVPSWRCQIDHLVPFTDGGPTAAENGDPKCGPHNRWKERLDAEIRRRQRWRREHLDNRRDPDPGADREQADREPADQGSAAA
ncbi:MAG: DUF222 domain-containing protein [Acidimicrobiales bacterium]|nr:DUF222 domain-containing protein [Acidimicrobiales bacterium]